MRRSPSSQTQFTPRSNPEGEDPEKITFKKSGGKIELKHENLKRGVNRLFLVLFFGWAICCAVLYPLQRQWEGQHEALIKYGKDIKNCDQLVVESPGWALTKDCYEDAFSNLKNTLEFYSFKNFWIFPVVFWRLFVPLIVLPPLALYGLAVLSVWIWRGFKPRVSN